MNKKKIIFILVAVAFFIGMGKFGLRIFEEAKTKPYKFMRKIETTINKVKPNILREEKEISEHMFYVSTPIGSIGLL